MPSQRKYADKLSGKRVLVFGGTAGIGFCVAEAAVEFGAHVVVASSSLEKIQKAVKRLSESYPDAANRIAGHQCDLSNVETLESNIEATFKFATEDGTKKLDHIVVTAGEPAIGSIPDITPAQIASTQTVRIVAPALMAKLIPKYAHMSHESSFTTTSGAGIYKPPPGFVLSCISGRGLEGLVTSMAVELAPLRANLVLPGAIQTEMMTTRYASNAALMQRFVDGTLTGAVGKPEDTAEAYLYIMRDSFITGSLIHTNGGQLLKTHITRY